MKKDIRVAVVGYGNVGSYTAKAVLASPDMTLCAIVDPFRKKKKTPENVATFTDTAALTDIDLAILCTPTRSVEACAIPLLERGISTVDSFDIHPKIVDLRRSLHAAATAGGTTAIVSAGWDPGSDSIIRTLLEACAPKGITYTNFGPGMSMGHTVALKKIDGVAGALSMTIPIGTGLHRRMLYVELEPGACFDTVCAAIRVDPYFMEDELNITQVENVENYIDSGHGVLMERRGVSGDTPNQTFSFSMRVNNPALTSQIMVACARAAMRQAPGAYTMIELPVVDLLPGEREDIIHRLV